MYLYWCESAGCGVEQSEDSFPKEEKEGKYNRFIVYINFYLPTGSESAAVVVAVALSVFCVTLTTSAGIVMAVFIHRNK